MRTFGWGLAVAGAVLAGGAARAQEGDAVRPVLDKAIRAVGPATKQTALQGFTCDGKGTVKVGEGITVELNGSWSLQGRDQVRGELTVTNNNGNNEGGTIGVAGDKVWLQDNNRGRTEKAPEEIVPLLRADFLALRLAQRPVLLLEKGPELSHLGELMIDGKEAVGLGAKFEGLPGIELYFDKQTGLPVKAACRVAEPNNLEAEHAFLFADYQEVDGLKHFTRLAFQRDGMEFLTMRLSNLRLHERLEVTLFRQPGEQ